MSLGQRPTLVERFAFPRRPAGLFGGEGSLRLGWFALFPDREGGLHIAWAGISFHAVLCFEACEQSVLLTCAARVLMIEGRRGSRAICDPECLHSVAFAWGCVDSIPCSPPSAPYLAIASARAYAFPRWRLCWSLGGCTLPGLASRFTQCYALRHVNKVCCSHVPRVCS